MNLGAGAPVVLPLARLDLVRDPGPWAMARERRAEIDAHFETLRQANPTLWNGQVLLLVRYAIEDGVFTGAYCETDFASFMWWRDAGYPDPAIRNAFAMGALVGADGGYVMGRMAPWTANPGRIYFASGTPDPSDVTPDQRVDLDGSVMRELVEETGLSADDVVADAGWHAVFIGPRIAFMRRLLARESAEALAGRIRAFIAGEECSELDEAVVVRGPGDVSEAMPDFVRTYLAAVWNGRGP